jgi:hypothetical protein
VVSSGGSGAAGSRRSSLQDSHASDGADCRRASSSRYEPGRSASPGATYESDLKRVNAYIQDAEQSVKKDPNDEQANQYLMAAYEQKAMVYEMALDRSLP